MGTKTWNITVQNKHEILSWPKHVVLRLKGRKWMARKLISSLVPHCWPFVAKQYRSITKNGKIAFGFYIIAPCLSLSILSNYYKDRQYQCQNGTDGIARPAVRSNLQKGQDLLAMSTEDQALVAIAKFLKSDLEKCCPRAFWLTANRARDLLASRFKKSPEKVLDYTRTVHDNAVQGFLHTAMWLE